MKSSRRSFLKFAGISALGLSTPPVLKAFAKESCEIVRVIVENEALSDTRNGYMSAYVNIKHRAKQFMNTDKYREYSGDRN